MESKKEKRRRKKKRKHLFENPNGVGAGSIEELAERGGIVELAVVDEVLVRI